MYFTLCSDRILFGKPLSFSVPQFLSGVMDIDFLISWHGMGGLDYENICIMVLDLFNCYGTMILLYNIRRLTKK